MKEIRLKAKSSSGGFYDVSFRREGGLLFVSCTCKASIYGNLCKHKIRLLNGDDSILYERNDAPALREVHEWLSQSTYSKLLADYDFLKKQIEDEKVKERKLRNRIEKILMEGIPIGTNKT
jgi:hypothetical protein